MTARVYTGRLWEARRQITINNIDFWRAWAIDGRWRNV
jgi:hypothetical protein